MRLLPCPFHNSGIFFDKMSYYGARVKIKSGMVELLQPCVVKAARPCIDLKSSIVNAPLRGRTWQVPKITISASNIWPLRLVKNILLPVSSGENKYSKGLYFFLKLFEKFDSWKSEKWRMQKRTDKLFAKFLILRRR